MGTDIGAAAGAGCGRARAVGLGLLVALAAAPARAQTVPPAPPDTLVAEARAAAHAAPELEATVDTLRVTVGPPVVIQCVAGTPTPAPGREASPRRFSPRRMALLAGGLAAADAMLMAALSELWYTEKGDWHWYSDAPPDLGIPDEGWLDDWNTYAQMDKGGHVIAPYHMARGFARMGEWTGLSQRGAAVFGGAVAFAFMAQIEVLDGYDRFYGASRTDLVADAVGAAGGAVGYALGGDREPVTLKVGYHPSPYYEDDLSYLGNSIKDYDGLSYWLVARPSEMGAPRWWPRALGVSLGYGADGLAHPTSGLTASGGRGGPEHRREFYLGLDLDILHSERHRLPRALRPVATALSFIRLPMPALQFGPAGTRWHWLYR